MFNIADNLEKLQLRIQLSVEKTNGLATPVRLIAVSKTRPASQVREAYALGLRDFGENYVQEALEKIQTLKDLSICWHFIGPLQGNKTRAVAEHFDWVHSIDRLKIARRLSEQRPEALGPLNCCIQVNISEQSSKSGVALDQVEKLADGMAGLQRLSLRGLMALPRASQDVDEQRQAFATLRQCLEKLKGKYPNMDTLSMGMSGDLEAAIAEGATMVRIGTALFGERPAKTVG
jgi:pyridoxal phosphate enzyme (YggS family)